MGIFNSPTSLSSFVLRHRDSSLTGVRNQVEESIFCAMAKLRFRDREIQRSRERQGGGGKRKTRKERQAKIKIVPAYIAGMFIM